ncbi:MAG: hypothetical protein NTU44_00015, partial [Bacteroidetes bacterium]|nr:hypothetical protein [Bacteroidota bacterium]
RPFGRSLPEGGRPRRRPAGRPQRRLPEAGVDTGLIIRSRENWTELARKDSWRFRLLCGLVA